MSPGSGEALMDLYSWVKALHLISIIAWMAGLLYLPRLFVYHATAKIGSELSETLKIMEYRLLKFIMTPAMILSFILGIRYILLVPEYLQEGWMHAKFAAVFLLAGTHGAMSAQRRAFAEDRNHKTSTFFRIFNEVPTVLMIAIVILVIVKPL